MSPAPVAQRIEQQPSNLSVVGSIPTGGAIVALTRCSSFGIRAHTALLPTSLPTCFSIGYAIWADSDRRPDAELRARLTLPLLVTCVGFSVWLAAAELEPNWTTLVIFLIMLAALLRALMYAMDQRQAIRAWSPLAGVLLWGTLGLYTGWSSVAVWLNLTTALIGSGAPITTLAAILGQAAILAGAVGTAVAITWFTRGLLMLL
jgi:hypothetical protein